MNCIVCSNKSPGKLRSRASTLTKCEDPFPNQEINCAHALMGLALEISH